MKLKAGAVEYKATSETFALEVYCQQESSEEKGLWLLASIQSPSLALGLSRGPLGSLTSDTRH